MILGHVRTCHVRSCLDPGCVCLRFINRVCEDKLTRQTSGSSQQVPVPRMAWAPGPQTMTSRGSRQHTRVSTSELPHCCVFLAAPGPQPPTREHLSDPTKGHGTLLWPQPSHSASVRACKCVCHQLIHRGEEKSRVFVSLQAIRIIKKESLLGKHALGL